MSTRGNSANEVTCGSSNSLQGWCICQGILEFETRPMCGMHCCLSSWGWLRHAHGAGCSMLCMDMQVKLDLLYNRCSAQSMQSS